MADQHLLDTRYLELIEELFDDWRPGTDRFIRERHPELAKAAIVATQELHKVWKQARDGKADQEVFEKALGAFGQSYLNQIHAFDAAERQRSGPSVFDLGAYELLNELRRQGVRLRLNRDGKQLQVSAAVTSEVIQEVKTKERELIRLLEAGEGAWIFVSEYSSKELLKMTTETNKTQEVGNQ